MQKAMTILSGEIPAPSLIEIDPSDKGCNQACLHCCFKSNPRRKMIFIDVEALLHFLKETYDYGTYAYELVGGGEPTNHPQIADIVYGIISLAKSNAERPHVGITTNGVFLHRIFSVAQYLDSVRISVDAPEATLYNLLHGVEARLNHFNKVVDNTKKLIRIIGGKRVRLGYLVVPPYNHQENVISAAAEFAFSLGVEHLAFRPAILDCAPSREMWREAARAIAKAKQKYRSGFIIGGVGGSWKYAVGDYKHPKGVCRTRPLVLAIKADGTIPSCFLYRERIAERPAIGHIAQGFAKVWFSERHRRNIQMTDRMACPQFCKLYRADIALEKLEKFVMSSTLVPILADSELDNPHFI